MERVTYEDLGPLVAALQAGRTVAIPTDTVYGLACAAHDRVACEALLWAKGRVARPADGDRRRAPSTARSTSVLPDLPAPARERVRRLLPGPADAGRAEPGPSLPRGCAASSPDADRPAVSRRSTPALAAAIDRVPALLLTSANVAGGSPAVAFADLDAGGAASPRWRSTAVPVPAALPSTVVDVTGDEPEILREGPVALAEIRARL